METYLLLQMPDLSIKTNVIPFVNFYRKSFHDVYIHLPSGEDIYIGVCNDLVSW